MDKQDKIAIIICILWTFGNIIEYHYFSPMNPMGICNFIMIIGILLYILYVSHKGPVIVNKYSKWDLKRKLIEIIRKRGSQNGYNIITWYCKELGGWLVSWCDVYICFSETSECEMTKSIYDKFTHKQLTEIVEKYSKQ